MVQPLADVELEARRILEAAESRSITLRLLGGTAFKFACPSSRSGPLSRPFAQDIDLAGHGAQSKQIRNLFEDLGYIPNKRFNALHGRTRLQFVDEVNDRVNDVFLDVFRMCHILNLKKRLQLAKYTLPLADLLLTKLQIVNLNEKDVKDALCMINDHRLGEIDDEDTINIRYIAELCSDDWGLYRTITGNLSQSIAAINDYSLKGEEKEMLRQKLEQILKAIEGHPKSLRWRMRAVIGERAIWYELPEAPVREPGKRYEVKEEGKV